MIYVGLFTPGMTSYKYRFIQSRIYDKAPMWIYRRTSTEDQSVLRHVRGDLVMNIEKAKSAKVTITANLTDYHFKWDGTGTLEVIDLEPGTYRTRIVADGEVTSLEAEVEAGRACAYRYDSATGDEVWTDARCSRR